MSTGTAPARVLVFGGTGPAGICLLRELLSRNHATVAYVRSPSKIPADLLSTYPSLLEMVEGQLDNKQLISSTLSKSRIDVVVSLLGPMVGIGARSALDAEALPGYYRDSIIPAMRESGVKRIFALSTISYTDPTGGDRFSALRQFMIGAVRVLAPAAYRVVTAVGRVFAEDKEAGGEKRVSEGLDWTVYRVPMIPGGSDEESWKKDREEGGVYVGPIGAPGWTVSIRRARLARWLVDCVEDVDGMGRRLVSKVVAVGGTKA